MASYQAPSQSFVALVTEQLAGVPESVLSRPARRSLVSYGRHLERKRLSRDGDLLLAARLLYAAEIATYVPTGKLGKGLVELSRVGDRLERNESLARRSARRRPRGQKEAEGPRSAVWG